MLLSLSLLLLVACIFGFKQSLALKQAQDQNNKQGLELDLVRTQYKHNLSTLSDLKAQYDLALSSIERKNREIRFLNKERLELKDNMCSTCSFYIVDNKQ
jgi:hypothetical protein|tara:strand:- start:35 stop:334 length:300 start_codon:yes stop_codon:yes gene_type:complete